MGKTPVDNTSQYPANCSSGYVDQNPGLDLLLATSVFYIAKSQDQGAAGLLGRYDSGRRDRKISEIPTSLETDDLFVLTRSTRTR